MKKHVVVLSTADFDSAVWTNKQHLAVGLSAANRVTYIESLGLRQPSVSGADIRRLVQRVMPGARKQLPDRRPEDVTVLTPRVIPFHRFSIVRAINRYVLNRFIAKNIPDAAAATLWTFSPVDYGLRDKFLATIYHSVDFLHEIPGIPRELVLRSEADLAHAADVIVCSSKAIQEHLENTSGKQVLLWENVAQTELFSAFDPNVEREDRVVFAGNLTPSKINIRLLQEIADSGVSLSVAGPINIDGAGESMGITNLFSNPNVTYHGLLDLKSLAALFSRSKIGIIPYLDNDYTRGVFPMKVFEYLAAGLAVVTTPIENLRHSAIHGLEVAPDETFTNQVRSALRAWTPAASASFSSAAADQSWSRRTRDANALLASLVESYGAS